MGELDQIIDVFQSSYLTKLRWILRRPTIAIASLDNHLVRDNRGRVRGEPIWTISEQPIIVPSFLMMPGYVTTTKSQINVLQSSK